MYMQYFINICAIFKCIYAIFMDLYRILLLYFVRCAFYMCDVVTLYVQCLHRVWLPDRESPTVGSRLWCYTKYYLVLQNCLLLLVGALSGKVVHLDSLCSKFQDRSEMIPGSNFGRETNSSWPLIRPN